jgi:ubiquinone biosynthesis protein Coq4
MGFYDQYADLPKPPQLERSPLFDIGELQSYPPESLGHELGRYFRAHALEAGFGSTDIAANDFDEITLRLREIHDVTHLVTGLGTDIGAEVALQAFVYAQLRTPLSAFLIVVNLARAFFSPRYDFTSMLEGIIQAYGAGQKAESFYEYDWHRNLGKSLQQVRRELSCERVLA